MDMAHCLPLGAAIHSLPECLAQGLETSQDLTKKSHAKGVAMELIQNVLTSESE
jgi:hypothetical protein